MDEAKGYDKVAANDFYMAELRAALARKGRNKKWLAERSGFTEAQVGKWLNNRMAIDVPKFIYLARVIGLSDDEIATAVKDATVAAVKAGQFAENGDQVSRRAPVVK